METGFPSNGTTRTTRSDPLAARAPVAAPAPRTQAGKAGSAVIAGDSPIIDASRPGAPPRSVPTTDSTRNLSTLDLPALLESVSQFIGPERRSLSFEIHEELGRTVVSVYDADTEELIRQIPPDELIRVAAVMHELAEQGEQRPASGLLLDAQA